jgi:hypothetical protein
MNKQFYKVTDIEDKITALVEKGERIMIAEHNSAEGRTSFRAVDSLNVRDFTGKLVEIEEGEYKEGLTAWGYTPAEEGQTVNTTDDTAAKEAEEAAAKAAADEAAEAAKNSAQAGGDVAGEQSDSSQASDAGNEAATSEAAQAGSSGDSSTGNASNGASTEASATSEGTEPSDATKAADAA